LLCAALWGATPVAVRFTQEDLPPILTAGLRFGLSCLFIYAWCRWQHWSVVLPRSLYRVALLIGFLLFAQIGLFHWGLTQTASGHGAVFMGAHSIFVALVAHFVLPGDQLTGRKLLGLSLAVVGLAAVVLTQSQPGQVQDQVTWLGNFVLLTSSIILAVKTVLEKLTLTRTTPATLVLWSNLFGTLLFFMTSFVLEDWTTLRLGGPAAAGLFYQGVLVAGFGFLTWSILLQKHPASQLVVFAFAQPLIGIVCGCLLRGDALTVSLLFGGLAVALGVYLVTTSR